MSQIKKLPLGEDPENPVRIYADGVFDQFHFGHAKLLEQCKKMYKHVHLIVGVSGQEETEKHKGNYNSKFVYFYSLF